MKLVQMNVRQDHIRHKRQADCKIVCASLNFRLARNQSRLRSATPPIVQGIGALQPIDREGFSIRHKTAVDMSHATVLLRSG